MNKTNRFAGADFGDSDEEVVQKQTKTQVKKEERKVTEKRAPRVNAKDMANGGFEVVAKDNQQARTQEAPRRGGRGAARPDGDRRGRGGRGGARPVRLDADGNKVGAGSNNRERRPFTGKPREEGHPMDRRDGTGRGRRPVVKKDGAGKGNVGLGEDQVYKRKGEENAPEEETKVEAPREEAREPVEPKVQYKEEVIGVSMDDFFGNRTKTGRAQAREAEGLKGQKVQENTDVKVQQSTAQQN